MKVIVFDTETTGLPEGWNTSILETDKWPHIVQISWVLFDIDKQEVVNMEDHIIKCNVPIPEESVRIHGITKQRSERKGVPLRDAMNLFDRDLQEADVAVAHNISFDKRMLMVEAIRHHRKQYFTRDGVKKQEVCTMKSTKDICKIERNNSKGEVYNKYPTLSELHNHLFGYNPSGTHDSMADVLICLRCYLLLETGKDIIKSNRGQLSSIYELYCGSY
uniref:Exonuclease domain-containing protein n=1 Tax=viral metagenome TaxID=1070528 RepID=A0A6C0LI91_9ZZZZ